MPLHPLFELNLPNGFDKDRHKKLRDAAHRSTETLRTHGARLASQMLMDEIGVTLAHGRDEGQYQDSLDYNLALVFAALNEPLLASEIVDRTRLLPASGGNLLFSDHLALSLSYFDEQRLAIDRGLPSFVLSSMPRSASAYFCQTISALLNIPVFRISLAGANEYWLMKHWVNCFTPGGGITHDHFSATPFNVDVLRKCQVRDVFVLARDPRASAVSAVRMKLGKEAPASFCEDVFTQFYLPWLSSWITLAKDAASPVKVHWISSAEVRSDVQSVVRRLFGFHRPLYPALAQFMDAPMPQVTANMNHGDDDRWRADVPSSVAERWWSMLPSDAIELLELKK